MSFIVGGGGLGSVGLLAPAKLVMDKKADVNADTAQFSYFPDDR